MYDLVGKPDNRVSLGGAHMMQILITYILKNVFVMQNVSFLITKL